MTEEKPMTDLADKLARVHDAEQRLTAEHGAAIEDWSEDGGLYVARGHMEPERFVALLHAWALEVWGCGDDAWLEDLSADDVQQTWAAPSDGCDPDEDEPWRLDVPSDTPYALAITWVDG